MGKIAYISLGSNIGDTNKNLFLAIEYLKKIQGISVVKTSSTYLTEPVGLKDQPWFANKVAKLSVSGVSSITLLRELLKIEDLLGRKRNIRWGPRTIDLDLLLFDREVLKSNELTLPHPRLTKRAFVLVPLLEIEPEVTLPNGEKLIFYLNKINYSISGNKIWQQD